MLRTKVTFLHAVFGTCAIDLQSLPYIFPWLYDYDKLVPLHKQVNSNVAPQSLLTGSGPESITLLTLCEENSYCHCWSGWVK